MPHIPRDVLDCTVYLYPDEGAADRGERVGGSGFLVAVLLEDHEAATIYAVTNAHVIAEGSSCLRLNLADGSHKALPLTPADWMHHFEGDDLVVAEIELSSDFQFKAIPSDMLIDGYDPTLFAVGQDAFMVGRFINHEGRQVNRPTVRFGNIAQLPYERIRTSQGIEQDAFLVDLHAIPGYSGSPVFVYQGRPDLDTNPENWVKSFEHRLLGVVFGHLRTYSPVLGADLDQPVDPPMWAEINSGLAAVIPAWRLRQILFEDETITAKREEGERRWLAATTSRPPTE